MLAVADVLGDAVLERLERVVQLVRLELALLADEVRGCSTAVCQAASSAPSSRDGSASSSAGAAAIRSRYTLRKPFRSSSWNSMRARLPSNCSAASPIRSRKVVYSSPVSSTTTKRTAPLRVRA
jgi:hypothetical protein